jgi:hypothetical protein
MEMAKIIDIIDIIETNPITKLSSTYNNKMLIKIQENFTEMEQQLFIASFYLYLNYNPLIDFAVDLDNIWKWLGFSTKQKCKILLERFFVENIDYKILGSPQENEEINNEKIGWGGHNKITFLLTIKCFKSLCLKSQTKKANEIHEYYMKLEEILHEIVDEETTELKKQLEQKETIIEQKETIILEIKETTQKEKQQAVEKALITQFPLNTECIYFGTIDNTNENNEKLIKFGHTNNLSTRVLDHHKTYDNFVLVNAFRVQNKVEIENLIKSYPKIKKQIRSIEVNDKNKTEIIAYDTTYFTIEKLSKYIKDIIHSKTYSIDNFNRMIKENEELLNENKELKDKIKSDKLIIDKTTVENNELREKLESQQKIIDSINDDNQKLYQKAPMSETDENKSFDDFVKKFCIVRPDVEVNCKDIIGKYRLCYKNTKKEVTMAFKDYLDTRFKYCRLQKQDKNQVVNGYKGIKLIEIEYKKSPISSDAQNFIFHACAFSPSGTILKASLITEYIDWKKSIDKPLTNNEASELTDYLKDNENVFYSTVWTSQGSGQGYYGLLFKSEEKDYKKPSTTSKKVYKREVSTDQVLGTWDTIAKTAEIENVSTAKMSRYIKNKTIVGDYYFSV